MSLLNILLATAAILSALGTASVLFLTRGKWRVDAYTARKLRRELEEQEETRNRLRIEQDLARADALRRELAQLTIRNNQQFDQIVDLRQEVLEMRQEIFELRQWAHQTATLAAGSALQLPPVPSIRVQSRRNRNGDSSDSGV